MITLNRFFKIRHHYTNPIDRQRAKGLYAGLMVSFVAWLIAIVLFAIPEIVSGQSIPFGFIVTLCLVFIVILLSLYSIQIGYLQLAIQSVTTVLTFIPLAILSARGFSISTFSPIFLPIIVAGVFSKRSTIVFIAVVNMFFFLVAMWLEYGTFEALISERLLGPLFVYGVAALFMFMFSGGVRDFLDQSVADVEQFRMVGEFSAQITHESENEVYANLIRLIRNDLGYSFAQIFLIDATGQITRRIRVGLSRDEDVTVAVVDIGDANALADAARSKTPVIVSSADSLVRRGHFLPSTNYAVAIPIVVQDQVVGVLDVQSNQSSFSDTRVLVLQTLVNQLSALLMDVRQIRALRESLDAQQTVNESLRTQLQEYKQYERQVVGTVWDQYFTSRGKQAVGFDWQKGSGIVPAYDLPEELITALKSGTPTVSTDVHGLQVIQVPIQLRGELLGAMTFTLPKGASVTDRQIEIAQNVTNRLTLALENKRLFEQSQSQAVREHKANEIASLLIGATDVTNVLELAAERFNEALGAVNTRISIEARSLQIPTEPSHGDERS